MPNNTGKTTTLNLLRAVFTGKIPEDTNEWRRIVVAENTESMLNDASEFSARLLINDESFRIKLLLDHVRRRSSFFHGRTTW